MDNRKRGNILLPVLLAVMLVAGVLIGMFVGRSGSQSELHSMLKEFSTIGNNKVSYTLSLIDKYYVDDVSTDSLIEVIMPDLMRELDPHSVYIPASEMMAANENLDGEFEGIGILFNMATDTVVVINVIPQGPSYKAGVQNGDRIIKIGDSLVAGQKIAQDRIVKMLRGKRGTKVEVSVERQGISSLVPISIVRDKIPLKSIDASFMIAPSTGFVRLSTFSRHTHEEFVRIADGLRGQGMDKLILDLRSNTGGFLDQAILLANEFLPEGQLIVYTEDRYGQRVKEYSNGRGKYLDTELVILIDEASASSSEILAGAIQDNDRGTIVGRRSFGKGLVQQQIPFPDGSAIRLTTARYYTPTGRSIQKPYTAGKDAGYEEDIYNRFLHNEMYSADSIHFDDSMRFVTPGGKVVYGGGGIMPDVFVPLDTAEVTKYYMEVMGRNIVYKYAMDYADRHRSEINAINDVGQLHALLDADKGLLDDFVAYASRSGVKPNYAEIRESEKLLLAQLRASIGRNTPLEDTGFFSNIYVVDSTILEALKILGAK